MLSDLPLDSTTSGTSHTTGSSELWDDALKVIARKLSAQNFDLWFRPIRCQGIDGHTIRLLAPNQFIKEWFETHYQQVVLEVIGEGSSRPYSISWTIDENHADDEPAPEPAAAKASPSPPKAVSEPPRPSDSASRRSSSTMQRGNKPSTENQDLGQELLARYIFDSFVIGPSNQLAAAASRAVADNPGGKYNPLFIYGGVGLGKTHLLHAIGHQIQADHPSWRILYLKTETFMNEYINMVRSGKIDEFRVKYRDNTDVLLMDDIQYLGGKERTQDEFFHTFNALFESHRQIVVTADKYPHEIPDLEERIRSRFQWGLIADIQAPELETRVAILQKKAELDQIALPPEMGQCWPFRIEEVSAYDERGPGWYWNNFSCGEHTGTHFDAPAHWITGKDHANNTVDQIDARNFIAPVVVVDASAEVAKNADWLLTVEFLEAWEAKHGRIPAGAWVAFRTDWSKRSDPEAYQKVFKVKMAEGRFGPLADDEFTRIAEKVSVINGVLAYTNSPTAAIPLVTPFEPGASYLIYKLLDQQDQVMRALAGNLVTYGTGAGIQFADRDAIEAIAKQAKADGAGLRSLVHAVVQSPLFLSK